LLLVILLFGRNLFNNLFRLLLFLGHLLLLPFFDHVRGLAESLEKLLGSIRLSLIDS